MKASKIVLQELEQVAGEGKARRKRPSSSGEGGADTGGRRTGPPVPPINAALATACKYSVYAGIALVNLGLGEKIFSGMGMAPPAVYKWAVDNRPSPAPPPACSDLSARCLLPPPLARPLPATASQQNSPARSGAGGGVLTVPFFVWPCAQGWPSRWA